MRLPVKTKLHIKWRHAWDNYFKKSCTFWMRIFILIYPHVDFSYVTLFIFHNSFHLIICLPHHYTSKNKIIIILKNIYEAKFLMGSQKKNFPSTLPFLFFFFPKGKFNVNNFVNGIFGKTSRRSVIFLSKSSLIIRNFIKITEQ